MGYFGSAGQYVRRASVKQRSMPLEFRLSTTRPTMPGGSRPAISLTGSQMPIPPSSCHATELASLSTMPPFSTTSKPPETFKE